MARARLDDLRRRGASERRAAVARAEAPRLSGEVSVTLRFAFPDDVPALARLATLDSSEPLSAPALVAEVSGELRAAVSLWDGAVIADPFHPSEAIVELLRARARQLTAAASAGGASRRSWGRLGLPAWR